MNPVLAATVDRIVELRDRELTLREQARALELIPSRREAAQALFRRASGLRKVRLALIERAGLN